MKTAAPRAPASATMGSPVAAAATPLTQEGSEMANLATEVKLYGRWSFEDVEVKDISLEDYIACKPKSLASVVGPYCSRRAEPGAAVGAASPARSAASGRRSPSPRPPSKQAKRAKRSTVSPAAPSLRP